MTAPLVLIAIFALAAGVIGAVALGLKFVAAFPRLALFLALAAAFHTFGISFLVYAALALWASSLRH